MIEPRGACSRARQLAPFVGASTLGPPRITNVHTHTHPHRERGREAPQPPLGDQRPGARPAPLVVRGCGLPPRLAHASSRRALRQPLPLQAGRGDRRGEPCSARRDGVCRGRQSCRGRPFTPGSPGPPPKMRGLLSSCHAPCPIAAQGARMSRGRVCPGGGRAGSAAARSSRRPA